MEQPVTTTTTKGIVIGLILTVIGITIYFANVDLNGPVKWVSNVVFVLGIIWSIYNYGKQVNYNSTFGNYFAHGFKVSAVVTIIMILYIAILITIFPDFKEKALEQAKEGMQKGGKMTSEQIQQGLALTKKFFLVFAIGGTLIGYLIFGALASLVGAAITKKQPNAFKDDPTQILQ